MYLQPTRTRFEINKHLDFLDIEKNQVDHHQINKKIHMNDDTNKKNIPQSSTYYIQRDNAFKKDIYNKKQSYAPIGGEDDFQPQYIEKINNRKMNVAYMPIPISQIPKMPKKVYKP